MPECFAGTYYPHLREVLDSRFVGLSDPELEEAFAEASAETRTPAEYEEFFQGLGKALEKVAQQTGRFAAATGPGVLQGAATGSALGPWGALGGGLAGGAGSALQRYGGREARGVGGVLSSAINTAGALTGRGTLASGLLGLAGRAVGASGAGGGLSGQLAGLAGPAAGLGGPASAALMALLRRPEMAQALTALSGGRNSPIPVGPQQVPMPANTFAGLLGALAREAEAEWWSPGAEAEETTAGDERSGRLLGLLVGAEQDEAEAEDTAVEAYEEYEEFDAYGGFGEYEDLDDADLGDVLTDDEAFAAEFDDLVGAQ